MAVVLGVPPLDRLLGSVPRGGRVLLVADPGTDGNRLIWQAAAARLAKGQDVVYVAWDRSPGRVRAALARHGAGDRLDHLHIVDCHSGPFDAGEAAAYHVHLDATAKEVAAALERAANDHPDAWAYVDSFSGVHDRFGGERRAWIAVQDSLRTFRAAIGLFTAWPYLDTGRGLREGFEAILRLEAVEDGVIRNQAFRVDRLDWRRGFDNHTRFLTTHDGGVDVLVPKLVVTGPDDAGKTTFIRSVSGPRMFEDTDRQGTTVAMDRGRFEEAGLKVEVWGTPGQARFDALIDQLLGGATGVILLVDAADTDSFDRARDLLARLQRFGLKVAVVANKQDLPGALAPTALRDALAVPATVPVIGCRAQSGDDARAALLSLLDHISVVGVRA